MGASRSVAALTALALMALIALMAVVVLFATLPASASAQSGQSGQSGPTLRAPSFLACGSAVSIEGSGFSAHEHYRIFASTSAEARMVARVTSDASGAFRATVP